MKRIYAFEESKSKGKKLLEDKKLLDTIFINKVSDYSCYSTGSFQEDLDGIDIWVHKNNGVKIGVDLKSLSINYEDKVPLETWSILPENGLQGKVGWTRDFTKKTDAILWYWHNSQEFLFIPYPPLREWFAENWQELKDKYRTSQQTSRKDEKIWKSECVFVEIREVANNVTPSEFHLYLGKI